MKKLPGKLLLEENADISQINPESNQSNKKLIKILWELYLIQKNWEVERVGSRCRILWRKHDVYYKFQGGKKINQSIWKHAQQKQLSCIALQNINRFNDTTWLTVPEIGPKAVYDFSPRNQTSFVVEKKKKTLAFVLFFSLIYIS